MIRFLFVGLFTLCSARAVLAQNASVPEAFQSVHEFIAAGIAAGKTPSVAVAVIDENRIVWSVGYGYADLENRRKATADSIYRLASVSKPLLATGLMKLVDTGKIDLDAPANKYLGEAKIRSSITDPSMILVRHLANHTSGLPVHWNFFYDGVTPPSRDETIRRYAFAINSPGAAWIYSNLAFGILDRIVSRQSGKPWGRYLEEAVFDPAGMSRTSDRIRPGFEKDATRQYTLDAAARFVRVDAYSFDHGGASACWSTANDLARFLLLHLNAGQIDGTRILSRKSAREMLRRTSNQPPSGTIGNGVAWFLGKQRGNPSFFHGGGMPGVATHIRGFPDSRSGVVVLTNSDNNAFKDAVVERLCAALMPAGKIEAERTLRDLPAETRTDFVGSWKGVFHHYQGDVPIDISLPASGPIMIRLGKSSPRELLGGTIRKNAVVGTLRGVTLATQASFHGKVDLEFELRLMMHELMGRATAKAAGYFALSHLVEVHRVKKN